MVPTDIIVRFNIICTSQIIEEKSNDIFSSPQTCLSCGLLLAFDENVPMRFPSRISIAISLYLAINKFLPNCMWFCDFIACPRLLTLQDEIVLKLFDHPPLIRSFNHGKENNFELCVQKLICEKWRMFYHQVTFVTLAVFSTFTFMILKAPSI